MKPKISVIIPVYNGEKTLKQCLDSVLNQTYKDYEVIVVDNNSTDKTKQIIKEFQKKDKKIRYVLESKRGRGAARNTGIKKSNGKIIVMTDSDCIVPTNWIRELTKPIICSNEDATMGSEKDLMKNYWTKNIQKANLKFINRNLTGKYIFHIDTKNFAIKSSIIKKNLFDPNILFHEDFELYLRLKKSVKIRYLHSVKVDHLHSNSFHSYIIKSFKRGYWVRKIFEKHRNKISIKNEAMTESVSLKNNILFPFWMILQFITKPLSLSFFILLSELSWRAGILWSKIS